MSDILDYAASNALAGGPSFSAANRLKRVVWGLVWGLLASWTPVPLHPWRRMLLRAFGAKVHPTAIIYSSVNVWLPANLEIGRGSSLGRRVNVYCMGRITIGAHTVVSQGVHLCAGTHDFEDPHFQLKAKPIRIGDHVWLAAESFVGPGVIVGDGVVLGARGVAMRHLDPWKVYSGNPAQCLKSRNIRFPKDA